MFSLSFTFSSSLSKYSFLCCETPSVLFCFVLFFYRSIPPVGGTPLQLSVTTICLQSADSPENEHKDNMETMYIKHR